MSGGLPATDPALHDVASYDPHRKVYIRTGVILTAITAFEIALLYMGLPKALLPPLMIVLAVVKFAMVVGTFMHLREDRNVYRLVFLAPVLMALAMIMVLGLLVMRHFAVYGPQAKSYVPLATQKTFAQRTGTGPVAVVRIEPKHSAEAYDKLFAAAGGDFSKGKALFSARCSACHGPTAGGMPGLGPNMTDDCYKHGGKIHDMVGVMLNGVPGTAMIAMGAGMKDEEVTAVALYLRSLRGTNVAGGKDCEGPKVKE